MKPNGALFYRGPSLLDGAPIIGIITGLSRSTANPKTGDMLQTWILRSRINPVKAALDGRDASICGSCALRGNGQRRSCYVTLAHSPLAVYKAYKCGNYHLLDLASIRGRAVRIGSYGDPAAIPTHVWQMILTNAKSWTGYTHQWRTCDPGLRSICMASVDNSDEAVVADALGWRYFRAHHALDTTRTPDEVICPASAEAGHLTTCEHCSLCQGTSKRAAKHVIIAAHGAGESHFPRERGRQYLPMA